MKSELTENTKTGCFEVFSAEMPDESTLLLTDSMPYPDAVNKSSAQFSAHMININAGHSSGIMKRCPTLYQYSLFIEEIRHNQKQGSTLREAVGTAVDTCIQKGILTDILLGNKAEVTNMILQEYDEELHIRNEKEISYQDGYEEGRRESLNEILAERKRADEEKKRNHILLLKLRGKSDKEIADTLHLPLEIIENVINQI